jgi:hypothetical protein
LRNRLLVLAIVAVAVGGIAPPAVAQTPRQDAVHGTATYRENSEDGWFIRIDARSGPLGGNPMGRVEIMRLANPHFDPGGPVTCLKVTGNRALVGWYDRSVTWGDFDLLYPRGLIEITDNGSPGVGRDVVRGGSISESVGRLDPIFGHGPIPCRDEFVVDGFWGVLPDVEPIFGSLQEFTVIDAPPSSSNQKTCVEQRGSVSFRSKQCRRPIRP